MRVLRSIGGVIAGIIVGMLMVLLLESLGHLIFPPPAGLDPYNAESVKQHLHELSLGAFISVLVAWSVAVLIGSGLAALIAGRGPFIHAGLVGFWFCACSIITMAMIPHPIWFMAAACAALPLATVCGGFLASLSHRKQPAESPS